MIVFVSAANGFVFWTSQEGLERWFAPCATARIPSFDWIREGVLTVDPPSAGKQSPLCDHAVGSAHGCTTALDEVERHFNGTFASVAIVGSRENNL